MDLGIKLFMALHVFLYRVSGGRLGDKWANFSFLLLKTTGRKSGKSYIVPLNFYRDGEDYVLVASNWGKDRHPGWYFNLMENRQASLWVRDDRIDVSARPAQDGDYERIWKIVTTGNRFYVNYQKRTDRKIPIVILTPKG